jgi:ubiquinol-cytochrome c reductase cytochrome c1 subunit
MMKGSLLRIALVASLTMGVTSAQAASGEVHFVYDMPALDMRDQSSLQRGAKYFMNYCSGCHGLQYMRYSQMAEGIGVTDADGKVNDKILKANLMFTADSTGALIQTAMDPKMAKQWFGTKVPDLTLETKARGADWVYNYLLSFYPDPKRPFGVNNTVYPEVAMPNVLESLQGIQKPVYETVGYDEDKRPIEVLSGFELVEKGALTPQEFQQVTYDLVNFLNFAADPKKIQRERAGVIVLLFLVIFTTFAYLLKREYWKDVE